MREGREGREGRGNRGGRGGKGDWGRERKGKVEGLTAMKNSYFRPWSVG